jgi:hypothetical protein
MMGITGGFGTTIDLERGTSRQWVIGRDGVKRWADSGEPVQKRATELPNDVARCAGVGDNDEGWREGCADCARRTAESTGDVTAWMLPPGIIAFWCEFRIAPNAGINRSREAASG